MRRFKDVNYYAVLGVSSSATRDEIKAAYRVAVRTAHPDAGGDRELFAAVSEAWEVLGDDNARGHYDADRRIAARASRPYTARLVRDEAGEEGADKKGDEPSTADAEAAETAAANRQAQDPDGISDAQRWLKNKRRL
jgi:curved DNA-binding protein CbpA